MTTPSAPQKSKVLSPEAFGRFLDWLSPEHDKAARLYLEIRKNLVGMFIRRGCIHSEDLADTTLDRAVLIVNDEPGKYSNPLALCFGVARKVWLEYLRQAKTDPLETDSVPVISYDDSHAREHEAGCLSECVERLPIRHRDLIVQYHQFRGREKIEMRKRLAEQHGGLNNLRIIAHRIRTRLNDCIRGCVERASDSLVQM